MITSRPLAKEDIPMLQQAIDDNTFHQDQKVEYYIGPDMFTKVYEDEAGPIGVLRYTKTLRLCTVWCNNRDRVRNGTATIKAIEDSVEMAKQSGYTEIIFKTNSPMLAKFCTTKLGFEESQGEYRKEI